ncbi:hypothetical protein V5O48_002295 [Marasmius crinis-equi]|uniref:F-box domain-containing protein n=1 Tax=Marasmius crinis-equi TaxID=585013 RepID=A0ABR3FW41_9AGAR
MSSRFSSASSHRSAPSLPGSIAYEDPLDEYDEDETYKGLPLAALPIAIDLEEDIIDILNVLPFDLVQSIIDLITDKRTLIACTLVCRAWVSRSRRHLFDMSIVRVNRVKADAFVDLFGSPHFSLRRLPHLELSFRGESSRLAEDVVPLLAKHRIEVESLHLLADSITSSNCGKALSSLSSTYKRSVTELSLQNYSSDSLRDVLPFVHSFGRLEVFRLAGRFSGRVSAKKLPVKLTKFSFSNESGSSRGSGTEQVLHWLSSPKDNIPPPLLELTIRGLGPTNIPELQKVLYFAGRNLQYLTLADLTIPGHDLIPDLHRLHSLRHISITPHNTNTLEYIVKMLMTVSSEFLEEIALSAGHIPLSELREPDFRCLDQAFDEIRCKRLTIKCHSTGTLLLRTWFPQCRKREIIEFVLTGSS